MTYARKGEVAFLVIATVALGLSSVYLWAQRGSQSPALEEIQTPDTWVPFSAAITIFEPGRNADVGGRYFRGADGSTRLETGPPGRRQAVISINNATASRMYVFSDKLGWTGIPIRGDWFRIPRFRVDNVRWFRHPETVEGFELVRWVDPKGTVLLHAPALNGEVIVWQWANGTRRALSQITLGDQSPDLFAPPPGASVREASQQEVDQMNNPETPRQ